jgi:predicted RNase H-like HicB family nuclease
MRTSTTIIEKCSETGLYVGYIPGFAGVHTQAASLDELKENIQEVLSMLLKDGPPNKINEFVGTALVQA